MLNLWAPATLIAGGMLAQTSLGSLRTAKVFALMMAATYGFSSAFFGCPCFFMVICWSIGLFHSSAVSGCRLQRGSSRLG